MSRPTHRPNSARARATGALLLAIVCVLSFALLSGPALTAAGVVSVTVTLVAIGYAIGADRRAGQSGRRSAYAEV